MIRMLLTGFLGLLITGNIQSQSDWKMTKSLKVACEGIAADPIGQFYLIHVGILTKYSGTGDSLYSWSDPSKGSITRLDATDPLRVLVYQQDFNLIRFLNNRLTPLADPLNLDNLGITTTLAIASSRQGGFWILDGNEFRLRRYGPQLALVSESAPLSLSIPEDKSGIRLFESGNRLWLIIPGHEIRQFDGFGNQVARMPSVLVTASPFNDKILLVYPDKITVFEGLAALETNLFRWTEEAMLDGWIQQNHLWIRMADKVIILSR